MILFFVYSLQTLLSRFYRKADGGCKCVCVCEHVLIWIFLGKNINEKITRFKMSKERLAPPYLILPSLFLKCSKKSNIYQLWPWASGHRKIIFTLASGETCSAISLTAYLYIIHLNKNNSNMLQACLDKEEELKTGKCPEKTDLSLRNSLVPFPGLISVFINFNK